MTGLSADEATTPQPRSTMQAAIDNHLREVTEFNAGLTHLIQALPDRMHHWKIGDEETIHTARFDRWSGDYTSDSSWLDLFQEQRPSSKAPELHVMFPSSDAFGETSYGRHSTLTRLSRQGQRTRALVQDSLPEDADELLADYFASGADARVHASVPLFVCADAHGTVAFSDGHDASRPDDIVVLQSPLIAGIVRDLFNKLWTAGRSLRHRRDRHEWSPLLRMLYQGETVDSASGKLGYTSRTARRKLNAAYDHYGVRTLFELGTAWGENIAESSPSNNDVQAGA